MITYVMSFLVVIAAFGMLTVPIIATCYLYYVEKRVGGFKFIALSRQDAGESVLENKLIKICFVFEGLSKFCVFLFVVVMIIRMLTRQF
jgi:hypothetical protein